MTDYVGKVLFLPFFWEEKPIGVRHQKISSCFHFILFKAGFEVLRVKLPKKVIKQREEKLSVSNKTSLLSAVLDFFHREIEIYLYLILSVESHTSSGLNSFTFFPKHRGD